MALVVEVEPLEHLAGGRSRGGDVGARKSAPITTFSSTSRPGMGARSGKCGDAAPATLRRARGRRSARRPKRMVPSSGGNAPAIMLKQRGLAGALGPITAKIARSSTVKTDLVDRLHAAEAFRQAVYCEERAHLTRRAGWSGARRAPAAATRLREAASPRRADRAHRTPASHRRIEAEGRQRLAQALGETGEQDGADDRSEQRADAADDRRQD